MRVHNMQYRVAIYVRQSLDRDGNELGVERQLAECQRLCETRNYQVIEVVTDNNRSATSGERPGYKHLMSLIEQRRVDLIVVLRVDRLLRRLTDLEALIELSERTGVTVATVEGDIDLASSSGRLIGRILASVARSEMETKSERHKLANAQKAAQGKPHGSRRPYGYTADMMTVYEPEAVVLRGMANRVMAGHTYKEISAWLNREGHVTTTGKLWYPITVLNMLKKKRYGGIRTYKGAEYPGIWKPVFDKDTWERLQLTIRLRETNRPPARKYLLTGLVQCGKCGAGMNGQVKQDRPTAPKRRTYHCCACDSVRRNADALDHFITECVMFRLDTPELGKLLSATDDGQLRVLLANREAQQLRGDGLADDYASGLLDKRQFARASQTSQAELKRLEDEIHQLTRQRSLVSLPVGQNVRTAWGQSESDQWRRNLLALLIKRIVVLPGKHAKKTPYLVNGQWMKFDPDAIQIEWLI